MNITIYNPNQLSNETKEAVNLLAAQGFGQDPDEMRPDTFAHIQAADSIQLAYDTNKLQAFAMYARCLWRICY